MTIKKLLFLLAVILCLHTPAFSFNENDDGFPSSYDPHLGEYDPKINSELNRQADELENQLSAVSYENSQVSVPVDSGTQSINTDEIAEELANAITQVENQALINTQNNITNSKDFQNLQNSKVDGDPVKLSQGSYEQEEVDITKGNNLPLTIQRSYSSERKIVSSFGYGWITNLDERIILGINADTDKIEQAYIDHINTIQALINNIENQIKSIYGVSKVESALPSLNHTLSRCSSNQSKAGSIASSLSSLETSAQGYPCLSRITGLKDSAERLKNSIDGKVQSAQSCLEKLQTRLEYLEKLTVQFEDAQQQLEQFREKNLLTKERKKINAYVMFEGMESWYEQTGENTITYIDEKSYPHILYQTQASAGTWKNPDEKNILECTQTSSGLRVLFCDGTEKFFDKAGFLIQIKDRNSNSIILTRNTKELISKIESSSGEGFTIAYNGKQISKITNTRNALECVSYSYKDKLLTGICDTDGDNITMNYNQGRLIEILKCDSSKVSFVYGLVTADGRFLTTETQDEEGFSEFFDYDLTENKTIYTNHDGNNTIYYHDKNHRVTHEILPDGSEKKYNYDNNGNLVSLNENGNITTYGYDSCGNKTNVWYSDGSYETFNYNNYNQLEYYRDRDGVVYEYLHDQKGNLIEYKCSNQVVYKQNFDSRGNVIKRTVYGGSEIVTEYEYDHYDNCILQTTAGIKTSYEYDSLNRIIKLSQNEKLLSRFSYQGKKTIQTDNNGLETTYIQNGRKDITEIIQKDTLTGIIHKTRIEYDKRHLPLKVYIGDGQNELLTNEYLYTPEGKIKKEIIAGEENFIKTYEYANGKIWKVNQFASTGNEMFSYKYEYQNKTDNEKLLTITNPLGYAVKFEYDVWGNLKKQTDANGNSINQTWSHQGRLKKLQSTYGGFYIYEYDNCGNLKKSGEENTAGVSTTYNADGSIKTQTDEFGNTTTFMYDKAGRIICHKKNPSFASIWYEYDFLGRVTKQITGASADETSAIYYATIEYSSNDRNTTVTEGGKYKTNCEYDAFGNLIKQTDGNGNQTRYEYDCKNQLVAAYDAYNNKTEYEYNALGAVKCITLPDGAKTHYAYNALGQLIKTTDEVGTVYFAEYDKGGRLIKEKTRADCEKSYEYDKADRITKILNGGQVIEEYTYEQQGQKLTVKDGKGLDYSYSYNSFGRLLSEKNRLNLSQSFSYDQQGNLAQQNNFDGSATTITWSNNHTVKTIHYSDGSENRFVYNPLGNITEAQNEYGKYLYEYDKGGRLVLQKDITTGEEIRFEYDCAGNRTLLQSSNRETRYTYGANNEIKKIFDNKQRLSVQLDYDKNGRELLRKFGNGTSEQTRYDKAGRITLKFQKNPQGELIWGEGYIYSSDGKRTATVDINGLVTLYEYDNQGRLSAIYYPYTKEHEAVIKNEAQTNGLSTSNFAAINRYLSADEKAALSSRLNEIQYSLGYSLTTMQLFIKEAYSYDKNGNRIAKETSFGKIEYSYDKENRLISSGSRGQQFVSYTYDKTGNLLVEESAFKTTKYAYNAQNRLIYCEVIDKAELTFTRTKYAYDVFGRRILVQDFEEPAMRTLYDGFTFDAIKQSPSFENGTFTDTYENSIRWTQAGQPTGERYRYLTDDVVDNNRYFYLDNETYKLVSNHYMGERTLLTANGTLAAQASSEGIQYFITDLLGSVRTSTDTCSYQLDNYTYDAFGSLIQGEFSGQSDYGYLSKQYDPTTNLYNYGYRDYNPLAARFTTTDPIRDSQNWFTYCNGDPVNFVDLWGLFYYRGNEQKASAAHKSTQVYIYRNDDGIGNDFNSTRMIFKDGICVYVDQVGANCTEQYYNGTTNLTEPDGTYYYSFENLQPNADGTYDSDSYHNVIRHKTNDKNIPEDIRNTINNAPGDFLDHANQKKDKGIYSATNPYSAGCTIGMGGQEHQDKFMEILLDGVDRPEEIQRILISNNNTHKKGD